MTMVKCLTCNAMNPDCEDCDGTGRVLGAKSVADDLSSDWYEDRDFPEVKVSNADVVAVVENKDQRKRIIDSHNTLTARVRELEAEILRQREINVRMAIEIVELRADMRALNPNKLADIFIGWPLPHPVVPDCRKPDDPLAHFDSGTNLLSWDQARQMFEYVFEKALKPESTESEDSTKVKS